MHRGEFASGRWFAAALVATLAGALGCSGPPPDSPAAVQQPGVVGVYFLVSVYRPTGGRIVSTDGQIDCGTGSTRCGPAQYAWTATATLNAVPDPGKMFGTWAGDCQYRGPCVLDTRRYGSDKYVLAVFGPQGVVQHGNFSSQTIHGPEYLDFLGGRPDSFTCTDGSCHGADLSGRGIAPGCTSCHVTAGWTSWQTNCSFCHGTSSAQTKGGYTVGAHPEWAAPPHSVRQRLTGVIGTDRTGAHQAHLAGVTSGGLRLSAPLACATCHSVPTDLTHVQGSQSRATVVLRGAQASLPASLGAYDPTSGTCATYCHGASPSPAWSSTGLQCGSCHGSPPPGHLPFQGGASGCALCHPTTVHADGSLDVDGGRHVDGVVQVTLTAEGTACSTCHQEGGAVASPHFSAPPALTDCGRCHGPQGHPIPGSAAVPEASCLACHTERG
jgi:predicted CxxxxCH...CXXCH cytochrome family protein